MPDRDFLEEYKNIKAPDELYSRIMNSAPSEASKGNVVPFRRLGSLAAAVAVIVLIGFVLMSQNSVPEIYLGGERLTGEVAVSQAETDSIMLLRAGTEVICELTLDLKNASVLTAVNGIVSDNDGNILLNEGEETELKDKISIKWTVPFADTELSYELKLCDKNGAYSVILSFDKNSGSWNAALSK